MSRFVSGTFTFDEQPCYCKTDGVPWAWGTGGGLYIQCPRCGAKAYATNDEFRCGIRFTKEKHYEKVDDCKVIPFKKR